METKMLIGNWKSNMTIAETTEWFQTIKSSSFPSRSQLNVILCVPFTVLAKAKDLIQELQIEIALGAQDVSPFGKGPYTGEISAEMIAELATYVLVGHSERRQYFEESQEERAFQVLQAKTAGLSVIYCTPDEHDEIPASVDVVAYEPTDAIGSGKPEDVHDVDHVCSSLKEKYHKPVLYGGSITSEYISFYAALNSVDGFLVGGASLDPDSFLKITQTLIHTL